MTADRGYGEAAVENALRDLGVRNVVIPRKGPPGKAHKPSNTDDRSAAPSSGGPGSKAASASLKHRYGWSRSHLAGTEGARIWTGHGVLAHNLVKIAALAR